MMVVGHFIKRFTLITSQMVQMVFHLNCFIIMETMILDVTFGTV